jgi:predicted nucleotidyltransferase component of viral defense system
MDDPRTPDAIATDYREARARGDRAGMARLQNEEACVVLLTLLARLAADEESFVHDVAFKGGILMAGELGSPRVSADIDATTGEQRRMDPERILSDMRRVGRDFDVRQSRDAERTPGGNVVHLAFASQTDAGTAKIEVSIREDLVFMVRDALFDVTHLGLEVFTLPALAEVELVAEKIRTLVQRAQPRDLFDLRLQLTDSGWHLDPQKLASAVEAKLKTTRYRRWRSGLWRVNLDDIEALWTATLGDWIEPDRIPDFSETVEVVGKRLRELRLD